MVSDEASCAYGTFESGLLAQTLQPAQVQLAKLGAPHDSILVDDLDLLNMRRYKLVIFLNCFHLTNAQRDLIRRRVLNQNRTVLWCYAPGLFNGPRTSVEAMRELTGIRLVLSNKAERVRAQIALTERGARLWSQPQPEHPGASGVASTALTNRAALPQSIGHEHVWAQLVAVEDAQAIALGTLQDRPEVVLGMKTMAGWISIYTLNPVLPAGFLRSLARYAGVHLYNEQNDTLYASRSYLTLAADRAGRRRIQLPRRADVFDPFTGQRLWHGVSAFERDFQAKETVIWRLADQASFQGRDRGASGAWWLRDRRE